MGITTIINSFMIYGSMLLTIMAALVFATNIIVEVLKVLVPKLPANYLAVIVAIAITITALYVVAAVMNIAVLWSYTVGAAIMGIFVAYAAMFGFDKFKEALGKIREMKT